MSVLFSPLKPMLLTMKKEAFDDDQYIHEPKWDGFRILLHKDGERIEAFKRNGNCITAQFPEIKGIGSSIRSHSAILDCEGVCIRDFRSVFDDFSYRGRLKDPRKIQLATKSHPASFIAFDLLYTDREHTREQLIERKKRLQEILEPNNILLPTMYVDGEGKALKQLTVERNWEGIVSKRKNSVYRLDTRSDDWVKIKNWKTINTVILGYRTEPTFALIVGLHFPTVLNKPVGIVEYGLKPEEKIAFLEVAKQIHTVKDKRAQWIEPRLCCKIQYLERTDNHKLRTTSFKSFLFDKKSEDCKWIS